MVTDADTPTDTPADTPAEAPEGTPLEERLRELAGSVPDPELPMLTLAELGVVRGVRRTGAAAVEVELTPTYTGCPAVESMAEDIERVLRERGGVAEVRVRRVLAPAWTTDDITAEGRRKLAEAGIAPPRTTLPPGPVPLTLSPRRSAATAPDDDATAAPGHTGTATPETDVPAAPAAARPGNATASAPGHPATATPEPAERAVRAGPARRSVTAVPTEPTGSAQPAVAPDPAAPAAGVRCPRCGSADTELLSPFSSTACKALRRCTACLEPFDHFKELR